MTTPTAGKDRDSADQSADRAAKQLVADSLTIQFKLGLVDYLGHSSIRLPGDRVVIKPKFSPSVSRMDRVSADDMLVISLDGEVLEGDVQPPAECRVHTEIYRRRPDVNAVVHTHQPGATLMGVLERPILPLLHVQSAVAEHEIPTWPCSVLVTTPDLGAQLAEALGSRKVCHLQGHGIVSVADTLEDATLQAIHLEQLAETSYKALAAGVEPRVIPADEMATLGEQLGPSASRWAYYRGIAGLTPQPD